eukprot:sb/3468112/
MSDGEESEYELNTLCEKITAVLTEQEWYNKNRSVSPTSTSHCKTRCSFQAFSSIIKKVKVNQYLSFDLFLSDVKSIFTVLRQDANHSTALDACEQAIAKELHSLIKMDYFAAGAESDTSANSSVLPVVSVVPVEEEDKKVEKETPSPTKSRKKRSSAVAGKTGKAEGGKAESPNAKTPVKQSPAKEKIKISLKPAVQKESAAFDFDQTSTRVQQICTNFVKKIRGKPSVAVIFSKLPTKADLPDYYEVINRHDTTAPPLMTQTSLRAMIHVM